MPRLTARENPFAVDRVERELAFRPEWVGTTWEALLDRLRTLGGRAALVGPHGAGKSTLLDALAQRLHEQDGAPVVRLFFNEDHTTPSTADWAALHELTHTRSHLLVDGDRHLPWITRWRLYRAARPARTFISCRHQTGRLPTLIHLQPDLALLQRCVQQVAADYYPRLAPHLPQWYAQRQGNIREVLLMAYDHLSRME